MKNNLKKRRKKGFTLIELVIVLAVLAIIALIAIPNFTRVRNNSLVQADESSCEQITNIIQTAIAEGVLEPNLKNAYAFDIIVTKNDSGKVVEITATKGAAGANGIPYNTSFVAKDSSKSAAELALEDHLRDIEAPQQAGYSHFEVNILAKTGEVTTKAVKPAKTPPR